MRITQEHVDTLYAADVVDQSGDKIGGVGQVYLDDASGAPAWVTVKTGLFGTSETFVPLGAADLENGQIRVPYEKDFVKDAPNMDADGHLDDGQQEELYRYYDMQSGDLAGTTTGTTPGTTGHHDAGYDTGTTAGTAPVVDVERDREGLDDRSDLTDDGSTRGHTHGTAEDRMTLHEERVDVGTERVETGRVRLRKHVVHDQETVTVPVEREEVEVVDEDTRLRDEDVDRRG